MQHSLKMISHWRSVPNFKRWYEKSRHCIEKLAAKNNLPVPTDFIAFGNVGCVLKTTDPEIIMKVTDFIEEAQLSQVVMDNKCEGFIHIIDVKEIKDGEHKVWLIWRKFLQLVREDALNEVASNLGIEKDKYCQKLSKLLDSYDNLVLSDPGPIIPKLKAFKGFECAAKSIEELTEMGLVVSDVKIKNIGCNVGDKQLTVFDSMLNTSSYFENEDGSEEENLHYGEDLDFYNEQNVEEN